MSREDFRLSEEIAVRVKGGVPRIADSHGFVLIQAASIKIGLRSFPARHVPLFPNYSHGRGPPGWFEAGKTERGFPFRGDRPWRKLS